MNPLVKKVEVKKKLSYCIELDKKIRSYAEKNNLEYVYNRDDLQKKFSDSPTIVNFFFHEKLKKTATGKF